jgi:thiosulfate reductase/polysulfide reductase chain A
LYSARLKELGHDPLPVYEPPKQPPPGAFRLVLGRKAFFTHANSTSNPWLFDFAPENRLWMNPRAAVKAGVDDGDLVEISSSAGAIRLRTRLTQEIRPDCVFMLHGYGKRSAWLTRAYNRGGSDAVLIETAWDKASGNAAMHETFVKVRKLAGGSHAG